MDTPTPTPTPTNGFSKWQTRAGTVVVMVLCSFGAIHEMFLVPDPRPEILFPCLAALGVPFFTKGKP